MVTALWELTRISFRHSGDTWEQVTGPTPLSGWLTLMPEAPVTSDQVLGRVTSFRLTTGHGHEGPRGSVGTCLWVLGASAAVVSSHRASFSVCGPRPQLPTSA